MNSYRITSPLIISDPVALASLAFPNGGWSRLESNEFYVLVDFATPQTPADLGPLVRVELVPEA